MLKKAKQLCKNKKGFTLVELMVSFTLTAIFMTAAVLVMSSFLKVYYRTNNISQSTGVADMLMEHITSELSLAASAPCDEKVSLKAVRIEQGTDGNTICYCDKNRNTVKMSVNEEGRLLLYYPPQISEGMVTRDEVYWEYKEEVYLNNKITDLSFTKGDGNVIKISMTLHNDKTNYSVNMERVIECFNLEASDMEVVTK